MVAVTELVARLGVVAGLDAAVGPIKARDRGYSAGQLLVGMAAAQLVGEDFLVGLDRVRADRAGQGLWPVPGLASTTAAGLVDDGLEDMLKRSDVVVSCAPHTPKSRGMMGPEQFAAMETALAVATTRMVGLLPAGRVRALAGSVTIDVDTTDVEVYGRAKRGVAYNYQGQRVGRPHVATWAEAGTALAADLLAGDVDPRPGAAALLRRALASLPEPVVRLVRARGQKVRLRADGGYFAGDLARAAHEQNIEFTITAKRIAPLWRLLSGIGETGWNGAIDMDGAQVAVAGYCPDWWPADTRLLIRRVRLRPEQVSADPRSRRRRTLHPDQRALPLPELAAEHVIYGYSFIMTNADVSTPEQAAAVEHRHRHRTEIENIFRDSKHGAALRHLPSGYPQVNTAWMWAALATHHRRLDPPTHRHRPPRRQPGRGAQGHELPRRHHGVLVRRLRGRRAVAHRLADVGRLRTVPEAHDRVQRRPDRLDSLPARAHGQRLARAPRLGWGG